MARTPHVGWKDRKGVVVPLAVLAVSVWGYVGYLLVAPSEAPPSPPPRPAPVPATSASVHAWRADFRDPFQEPAPRPAASPGPDREVQAPSQLPAFGLLGLVDGTATIVAPNGEVFLATRGSTWGDTQVLSVSESTVTLRHAGRTKTLTWD